MKINRLVEIIIILLNRGTVTAKELAEHFSVSTRTIYRDIDVLSSSGVPVFAMQGVNGGISLLENYSLNRAMLSDKESESILFALKALQVTKYPEIDIVMEKLSTIFKNNAADWIHIDFSPWGSNPDQYNKMTNLKNAILNCKTIEFDYVSSSNKRTHRALEPLRLIFKGQAWYLWGFCMEREDFRTFRISRIRGLMVHDEVFDRMRERMLKSSEDTETENEIPIASLELRFVEPAAYRLFDDYDDTLITQNTDGTYTLKIDLPEDEWVYGYILSFGAYVEVIEPLHVREIIKERIKQMGYKYDIQ